MGATSYNVSGTGTWYGDSMSTGSSAARKYVTINSATFNTSTGVTTLKYDVGIHVDSGDFYGSNVDYGGWSGYYGSVSLNGTGWYAYHNNNTATVAHNSTKKFYEWCGYTSSSAGGYIDSEVYVTFTPSLPTYAISYNANSGSGTTSEQTKTWGTALTLRANGFTRSGYTFKRWNTNASDTGTGYSASASYTANAAATLYAIWNRTVTYNANTTDTVSNLPAAQTGVATSAITLTSTVPTRMGFDFTGWNTAANGSGTSYAAGGSYPANNPSVVLYAQWRSAATITSLTAVRCSDNQGTQDDMGTYADVTCMWENPNSDATISGTVTPVGGTATTLTFSTTSSGTTYTSIARPGAAPTDSSAIDTDTQYKVTVNLTVSGTVVASKTIILTKSAFVMDFKAGGTGIGIGTAAPASGLEVAWPATFDGNVTIQKSSSPLYIGKDSDVNLASATNDITSTHYPGFEVIDNANRIAVRLEEVAQADGANGFNLYARQYNTSGTQTAQLGIKGMIAQDTTAMTYTVSSPANFRSAISARPLPTVLYNNATGTAGTVTLSASAANYNHMRIYYRASDNSGNPVNSVDIYSPNGKYVGLATFYTKDANGFTMRASMRYISGTSMSVSGQGGVGWLTGSSGSWGGSGGGSTNIYVVRVEGWNE